MSEGLQAQFEEHQRVIQAAAEQIPLLERIIDRLADVFRAGGKLYVLGNGGSAADAQHIAAELVGRLHKNRRALPAVALTTDTSILTAVANDFSALHIFERQVEALVTERDAVWALSVSGTSPNVIQAVELARKRRATLIGFTGKRGQKLAELCDLCFMADHERSDRVQEAHQLAYHLICAELELCVSASDAR